MLGRSILILAVLAATIALTARSSLSETTACRTDPGAPAPQGLHWYYRVDRTGNRHCWFLDSTGTPVPLHKDLATSNLRSQVTAEQVLASPENDTVPTAPAQRATPETVAAETTAQEPSVRGRAATDFTARWFDLPKSVDLDAREFAVPRQTDAAGHTAPDSDVVYCCGHRRWIARQPRQDTKVRVDLSRWCTRNTPVRRSVSTD
jgi:hypothetical protein